MAHSNPKLHLLFLAGLFLMLANNAHSQDTTTFTHNSFNPKPADLIYQRDAHVQSGSSSLHLTRTNSSGYPLGNSVGRVVYSLPIPFWDCNYGELYSRQASFETNIDFTITSVDNDPADGIAFFIVPFNSSIPSDSTGGNFGLFNSSGTASSVFAVEFDNYVNHEWDPSHRHIGIDVNSRESINTTEFNSALGQNVHARINYESITRRITVEATVGSQHVSLTNVVFNLESILPQQVQVGISASTGTAVALHQVNAWEFTSTLERENSYNPKCLLRNEDDAHIVQYV